MTSIRRRLLVWLLSGLLAGVVAAGIRMYVQTLAEADVLFDYHLKTIAASLPDEAFGPVPPSQGGDSDFVVQIWDQRGLQLYFSNPSSRLPERAELGYSTVETEHGPWRVYSALAGNNIVQVAQPMSVRRELAVGMALRAIVPLVLLLPLLGALIWVTVGHGLGPLRRLAVAVGQRTPASLEPLAEEAQPEETRPLVHALNDLLGRLKRALDAQKAFVADAAHELRTPLTAVQLQLQLVERARSDAERRAALDDLREGLSRASHLVQQLLTLARGEPGVAEQSFAAVDLADVARLTIAALHPLAAAKEIDLGLGHADSATVQGDLEALRVMLGNVIDNAIRHTPRNGTIDVAVRSQGSRATLEVTDSGPGIAPEHRERVFDRFYRVAGGRWPDESRRDEIQGSGLGLAIVKSIADRHGATIALGDGPEGRGLRFSISFPRVPEGTTGRDSEHRA